ncbi:Rho termination factor N-terminal domain-containing protein [Xiamenia xianingshaonis]|uniref:Rho termination factor N-terminal domain-containing protein n=1 Tax=Xiamenia xianingshaonis TaxID=2682776 RepID=A0A9E6SUJ2_9ACTN|nr:Rho termination factor N-terminal domain-containing protein [Xiamenia xianingshaonis]NHM14674.1 hypothetical protein [Xiamenia xianingshaonis]QTU84292.1 Rho termination factor N-terminal domain-containing protein [Xiamenia xianingshaonis]
MATAKTNSETPKKRNAASKVLSTKAKTAAPDQLVVEAEQTAQPAPGASSAAAPFAALVGQPEELACTLNGLKKTDLTALAKELALTGTSKLRKAELADQVAKALVENASAPAEAAADAPTEQSAAAEAAPTEQNSGAAETPAAEAAAEEQPQPKRTRKPKAAAKPKPKLVPASAPADAIRCANMYAQVAGVVSLADLWQLYQMHYPSSYSQTDFNKLLSGATPAGANFRVWFFEGDTYVALGELFDGIEDPWVYMVATTESSTETEWFRRFAARRHRVLPIKRVWGDLAEYDLLADMLALPAVQDLRTFLQAHAANAEAADKLLDKVVSLIRQEENESKLMDACASAGISLADASDNGELRRLLHAANATLPHWVHNGWSPQEIEEHLVGTVYFNAPK